MSVKSEIKKISIGQMVTIAGAIVLAGVISGMIARQSA